MATELRTKGDVMQNLLNWGTANTAPDAERPSEEQTKENIKILNSIYADQGPSDAQRMKSAMIVIDDQHADTTLDEKLNAWDELELLVESLDNANDLKPLGLWPSIVKHLTNSEPEMAVQALWVCGTAIQNNPDSQNEFLALDPLPSILSQIKSTSRPASVRSKAIYCLSSALKHSAVAMEAFTKHSGWDALCFALEDPDITCRRKAAFLVDSIFSHAESDFSQLVQGARQAGAIEALVHSAVAGSSMKPFGVNGDQTEDADLQEKAVRALVAVVSRDSTSLESGEKKQVQQALESGSLDEAYTQAEKAQVLSTLSS